MLFRDADASARSPYVNASPHGDPVSSAYVDAGSNVDANANASADLDACPYMDTHSHFDTYSYS